MTDIARLGIQIESGTAVKATSDLDRLGDQAAVTGRQVKTATANANRGFSSMATPMRGVVQQLSQVAQQGQATGQWAQAFAIQGADIGMAFGTLGTILGVAAGLLLPLAANLLEGAGAAQSLDEQIQDLDAALDALASTNRQAQTSLSGLRDTYGNYAEGVREVLDAQRELAALRVEQALTTATNTLSNAYGDLSIRVDDMGSTLGGYEVTLRKIIRTTNATGDEAIALVRALQGLKDSEGAENQVAAIRKVRLSILDATDGVEGMDDKTRSH